ncbi:hypothetical protein BDB00DRAFT_878106 [Zychaea mexicana]|uniref:uncharacterized protein n=1 Tax=Zychaea mexicana TaxID=64656 RepID=UPI0022FE4DBA|nr:uncharacterized protein BDB00DRAFT_878106 [Zychaea mexicana]KAI9485077.1 hypothetical protein BDB00DRAFT_878106 [Zychaea mexicana]
MASYGGAGSALANELPDTVDGLLWRMRVFKCLSEATSTPCGHTFCQDCIHQALRSGMTGCPVCKQLVHRRRLYDASSVDLIVHEFLQLRAAYEQESGHAIPISNQGTNQGYQRRAAAEAVEANEEDGPIPQTMNTDATDVTSLEIRQGGERDQQQQEHSSCEHIIACTGIHDNNVGYFLSGLVCHGGVRNEEPGATVDRVRLSGLVSLAFGPLTFGPLAIVSRQSTLGNQLSGSRLSANDARQSAPSFSVRLPASEYPVNSSSSIRQQQQMAVLLAIFNRLLALDSRDYVYAMAPARLYQ